MSTSAAEKTTNNYIEYDVLFGLVAGLYIAGLLSPLLHFPVTQWLTVRGTLLSLGIVSLSIVGLVLFLVTQYNTLIKYFDSTLSALAIPGLGVVPTVIYADLMLQHIAGSVTELSITAESTIGFLGFFSGLGTGSLGVLLVYMSRKYPHIKSNNKNNVEIEWTAGLPPQRRFTIIISMILVFTLFTGVAWQRNIPVPVVIYIGSVGMIYVHSLNLSFTYSVTQEGLVRLQNRRFFAPVKLYAWREFDSLSVSKSGITLHRNFPHRDIQFARNDVIEDEQEIIDKIKTHITKK